MPKVCGKSGEIEVEAVCLEVCVCGGEEEIAGGDEEMLMIEAATGEEGLELDLDAGAELEEMSVIDGSSNAALRDAFDIFENLVSNLKSRSKQTPSQRPIWC